MPRSRPRPVSAPLLRRRREGCLSHGKAHRIAARSGTSDPGKRPRPPARTDLEWQLESPGPSRADPERAPQRREGRSMIPAEVVTLVAVGDCADQDGLARTEVIRRLGPWQLTMEIARNRHEIED